MSEPNSIIEGITIGAFGGAAAGIIIWVLQLAHEKCNDCRDKKRILKWMKEHSGHKETKMFRSTRTIASHNNLTEDRVRYICSIHEDICLSTGENEDMWGLVEKVPTRKV